MTLGAHVWKHDTSKSIWGSLLAGNRFYVGSVAGSMSILRIGRQKQVIGEIETGEPIYTPPGLVGDAASFER